MIFSKDIAFKTAEYLLQIKAIKLNITNPFQWASGWKSPIYCDNRAILSYPKVRNFIIQSLSELIIKKFNQVDAISGVATGAIAHGVLVSQNLNKPFSYVRVSAKSHGLQNHIEGHLENNHRVLIVEDLISTGQSSLNALAAIRENGNKVIGMAAIFTYDFGLSRENFQNNNCQLFTLCDYPTLLEYANINGLISKSELSVLEEWNRNPKDWA